MIALLANLILTLALLMPVGLKACTSDPAPAVQGTTMVIGDSIANGVAATSSFGWVQQLGYMENAVNGASLNFTVNPSTGPNALVSSQIDAWGGFVPDTVIIAAGINDMNFGRTAYETALAFTRYEQRLRRLGVDNVLIMTLTSWHPSIDFFLGGGFFAANDPKRRELNDWLRQTWRPRGQLIDCGYVLGDPMDTSFTPDALHPNQAGHNALAACVGPAVDSLTL